MKDAQGYKIRQEKKQKIEEAAAKAGQPSKDTAMRVSAIIILKYLHMARTNCYQYDYDNYYPYSLGCSHDFNIKFVCGYSAVANSKQLFPMIVNPKTRSPLSLFLVCFIIANN